MNDFDQRFQSASSDFQRAAGSPEIGARILVVEDSSTQSKVLQLVLEAAGHTVAVAADGDTALELFGKDSFDLVISDIVMPGMSGYELCRKIKQAARGHEIPVMLLSSLNNPMDIILGLECGADNFV